MSKPFVVVVVATQTEFRASQKLLENTLHGSLFPGVNSLLVDLDSVFLVIEKLPSMGNICSALTTSRAVQMYRPICVVGGGICGGTEMNARNRRREFCDLVVSNHVVYYEPGKKRSGRDEWRPQPPLLSTVPAALARRFRRPSDDVIRGVLPRGVARLNPKVHRGMYASGELVVSDRKFAQKLRSDCAREFAKDVAAIEMEAAGIAFACSQSGTKFVIVKAISDFASRKDDKWQECAATISLASIINWVRSLNSEDVAILASPIPSARPEDLYDRVTRQVVRAAGMLLPRGVSLQEVTDRAIDDLRTKYDENSELFLRGALSSIPSTVIGEEFEEYDEEHLRPGAGEWWVVDPLDGTQNFVAGRPEVAISAACYVDRLPKVAAVFLPYRNILLSVAANRQMEVNGLPWNRRRPAPLRVADATVALPGDMRRLPKDSLLPILEKICARAASVRITGALAYDLACLALGEIDARVSTLAKLVDVAAGAMLVKSAGGFVCDIEGKPWDFDSRTVVAAANQSLLNEILAIIRELKTSAPPSA